MPAMEAVAAVALPRRWTDTERNWLKASALVVGSILLFTLIEAAEQAWGGRYKTERLVYHPVETSMRLLAIPHFLIAILFTVTSRRMRQTRTWATYLLLAAGGALLCWLFREAGGREGLVAKALFMLYFAVHEFRDETFFYVANGDAPPGCDARRLSAEVLRLPAFALCVGVSLFVLAASLPLRGAGRYAPALFGEIAAPARLALGVLPLLATGLWGYALFGRPGSARAYIRSHRPLVRVFLWISLLILADLLFYGRVRALITLHVTAWYVFTVHQLSRRAAPSPPSRPLSWSWMRTTPRGFSFLHIGLFAAVVAAALMWAYGFRNGTALRAFHLLLSREAFPYWTIMHISLSFLPRG